MNITEKTFTLDKNTIVSQYESNIDFNMRYISKMLITYENGYDPSWYLMCNEESISHEYRYPFTGFYNNKRCINIDTIENLINDNLIGIIDDNTLDCPSLYYNIINTALSNKYELYKLLIYTVKDNSTDYFVADNIIKTDITVEGIEISQEPEVYTVSVSDQNFSHMRNSSFASYPMNHIYGAVQIDNNYDYIIECDSELLDTYEIVEYDCTYGNVFNTSRSYKIKNMNSAENFKKTIIIDSSSITPTFPSGSTSISSNISTTISDDVITTYLNDEQTIYFDGEILDTYYLYKYDYGYLRRLGKINDAISAGDLIVNSDNSITIKSGLFGDTMDSFYCIININILEDETYTYNLIPTSYDYIFKYKVTLENNKAILEFNKDIKYNNPILYCINNESGTLIPSTNTCYRLNSSLEDPYYFETSGEHTIEFEYINKFNPCALIRSCSNNYLNINNTYSEYIYLFNSTPFEINDKFYDYFNHLGFFNTDLSSDSMHIDTIRFSKNVKPEIYNEILSKYNCNNVICNIDRSITLNNCVLYNDETDGWGCVFIGAGDIIIPNFVKWINVINCNATSLVLPQSITSIPEDAFSYSESLTSITIPDSVTSIGNNAFQYCSNLTSINIGTGVTSIGNNAFQYCSNLTSVNISSLESWVNIDFDDEDSNPLYYAKNLYLNGQLITDLVIPNSVTSIGQYAFDGCSSLTSVEIPDSVTEIGVNVFRDCSNLTSVTVGNSVTSIGGSAFFGCSNLSEITCYATTAPNITSTTFLTVKTGGVLKVPTGATGYDAWMSTSNYYLGKYGWTIQYI